MRSGARKTQAKAYYSEPRVQAYVRVSSRTQKSAMQVHAIEQAVRARGERLGTIYTEKQSARTLKRPVLDHVRDLARMGAISKLYVYRLDRLSRSGIRDTLNLLEELRGHGCSVVTVADGFSLEGPAAEVVLAVFAWAAQMERLVINERISCARDRIEAEGGTWGRPRTMSVAQRRRAHQLRAAGKTVRAIAIALKVSKSTIERGLQKERPC